MSSQKTRKTTSTSDYGTAGRICHDSTRFYNRSLYENQPCQQEVAYHENTIPRRFLDTILHKSSESMQELPECSIHLMVTSPPYNVGKQYDEDMTLEQYRAFLKKVWHETHRVLVPGGRACINIANLGRKPYIPLHAYIALDMLEIGFLMRGEVVWDKGTSSMSSTAWGSWMSPTNPTLRDVHEYILIFSKQSYKRVNPLRRNSTTTRKLFLDCTRSIWTFPAVSAKKIGHPAPFPIELPYRCIELYTFEQEVVLDPFMGSGQTAIAALRANRHFVGYETNSEYIELAEKRVQAEQRRLRSLLPLTPASQNTR